MQIIDGKIGGALKAVLYGPEGIGKTTLAARFPRPLFIDTEGSTRHMDVCRTEFPRAWEEILRQLREAADYGGTYRSVIVDTLDAAEALCVRHVLTAHKAQSVESFGYGKGYVFVADEFRALLAACDHLVERGINVILTAHARMRKFEQPDELGAYDRWELKLTRQVAPLVKEWCDLLLFLNYKTLPVAVDKQGQKFKATGGERVMYTSHHPCWDAKNRFQLPDELPLDFQAIARCLPEEPQTEPVAPPSEPAADTRPEAAVVPPSEPAEPEIGHTRLPSEPSALEDLRALMREYRVSEEELSDAIAVRGYFPRDTPLERLPEEFIDHVLISAWLQVLALIQQRRADEDEDLPF